jgi:hypothetical protein
VLRSVIAIGAINKAAKKSYEATSCPPQLRDVNNHVASLHREFALESYGKALAGMRQIQQDDPDNTTNLRRAIMATVLIQCLEVYLGSPPVGYKQSHNGYKLLHNWRERTDRRDAGVCSPDPAVIEDDLFHEISRLDHQSALLHVLPHCPMRHLRGRLEASQTVQEMPSEFYNLDEARAYQKLIWRRSTHLIEEVHFRITEAKREFGHAPTADTPSNIVDPCFIPQSLLGERDSYLAEIRRWCLAFRPLLATLISSRDAKSAVGSSLLMVEILHCEFSLAGAFFTEETSYDAFLPQFRELVFLCKIVTKREEEYLSRDNPRFQLATGISFCLYEILAACRDEYLRKEALSMLRDEALLNATKYIHIQVTHAMWQIAIEDKFRQRDGTIPESARCRRIDLNFLKHSYCGEEADGAHFLTFLSPRRLGYPMGKAYPAKREWIRTTILLQDATNMILGDKIEAPSDEPWPKGVLKPNYIKWQELHAELLERTKDTRLALSLEKRTFNKLNDILVDQCCSDVSA